MRSLHLRTQLSRASGRLQLAVDLVIKLHNGAERTCSAPFDFIEYQTLSDAFLKLDINGTTQVLSIQAPASLSSHFVKED